MSDDSANTECRHATLAILAGGEGRRMGRPKGDLLIEGQPILEQLLDRVNWPGPTLLVTAPGREHPPGWQRFTKEATDPVADEGPLRGILTALEHASTNEVVVLPVDMPNVTTTPLAWLVARLQEHLEAAAVMVRRFEGASYHIEPLPIALRVTHAKALVRARLSDRHLALHQLAESVEIIVIPVPSDWPDDFWTNLNTPSNLTAYKLLASGGGRAKRVT